MRQPREVWYEAQYYSEDNGWTLWEAFTYDHDSYGPAARLGARAAAIKAAKDCYLKLRRPVRVLHCDQTYRAGIPAGVLDVA